MSIWILLTLDSHESIGLKSDDDDGNDDSGDGA